MPDGGTVHTEAVTPDPAAAEREASTRTALKSHKASCAPSADVLPCQRCTELTAAWREALRALRYAPLNHAPAESGQTATTTGDTR